jgi:hypothetical protein
LLSDIEDSLISQISEVEVCFWSFKLNFELELPDSALDNHNRTLFEEATMICVKVCETKSLLENETFFDTKMLIYISLHYQ